MTSGASNIDKHHLRQAAEWYATLRADDVNDETRKEWRVWLTSHPAHAQAWDRIGTISRRLAPLHEVDSPRAVVAGARAAHLSVAGRRRSVKTIVALTGAGVAGWFGLHHAPLNKMVLAARSDFYSGVGEQRYIILADGSHIWLNTGTAVNVDYTAEHRRLALLAGEVFVETAKDVALRPFYVQTRDGRLEALGTRFNVEQISTATRVDVFEGLIEIRNPAGLVCRVPAGHSTHFNASSIALLNGADPARDAWRRGLVIANNITLEALANELSRYWNGQIHVSESIAQRKVMGVYPADDPVKALSMVARVLPFTIKRPLPWWITIEEIKPT